jgi:hypothetical protein
MKAKSKTKKRRTKKAKFPPITPSERILVAAFLMSMAVFSERMVEPATKLFSTLSDTDQVAAMAVGDKIIGALKS